MNLKTIKLALSKMIANFEELKYDGVTYLWDGDLDYGVEVYQDGDSELVPAENVEFVYEDNTYTIEGGVVHKINGEEKTGGVEELEETPEIVEVVEEELEDVEMVEEEVVEVVEEELEDEKLDEISELRSKIEELERIVAELEVRVMASDGALVEFKKQVSAIPMAKPADVEIKESGKVQANGAGKYFQALNN